jgi:hypothetical protein
MVGLEEEQKICEALPVGAAGELIVAVTSKRVALSQPLTVCEAKYDVASTNEVVPANGEPPEPAAYHCMFEPVAVRSATVAELQKLCDAEPVGAAGELMVAVASKRVALSQPLTVCEAK